jgi:hypothetical protein
MSTSSMPTASAVRRPLATVSDSVLNSPQSEVRKASSVVSKHASKKERKERKNSFTKSASALATSIEIRSDDSYKDCLSHALTQTLNKASPVKKSKPILVISTGSSSNGSSSHSSSKNTVEIIFPPGNMGLDLEPLISSVSPERLIGCKVKDFYFSIDHSGVDEDSLRLAVSPGDIISSINGTEVLFAQFIDILEKLRGLKPTQRQVCFKKLSTEESK